MKMIRRKPVSQNTIVLYWSLSLGAGLAVIGVVALLLEILAKLADHILAGVAQIWQVGKLIANNTVHVPLLVRTNQIVTDIYGSAAGIIKATRRIRHAVHAGSE